MNIAIAIVQVLFLLLIAPMVVGMIRKWKAFFQNRKGASIIIPYYQILSLFKKEMTISRYSSWVFRFAPVVVLAVCIMLLFGVPVFSSIVLLSPVGNVFLFGMLVALASAFLVLGGMDTSSTFGHMGSSREMTLAAMIEPAVLVVGAVLGGMASTWEWSSIILFFAQHPYAYLVPLLLILIAFLMILLLENARYPVDNPATHLELTMVHEAMVLEHSGPLLAFLEYASALKITIFSLLFMHLAFPFFLLPQSIPEMGFSLFVAVLKLCVAAFFIAAIESFVVKMRFYRMQEYTTLALSFAVAGAIAFLGFSFL